MCACYLNQPPSGAITRTTKSGVDYQHALAVLLQAQSLQPCKGASMLAMGPSLGKMPAISLLLTCRFHCQKLAKTTEGYRAALLQLHPLIQNDLWHSR